LIHGADYPEGFFYLSTIRAGNRKKGVTGSSCCSQINHLPGGVGSVNGGIWIEIVKGLTKISIQKSGIDVVEPIRNIR